MHRRMMRNPILVSLLWIVAHLSFAFVALAKSVPNSIPEPTAEFSEMPNIPTNGAIDDIKCNVEDLERANDSQLYTILQELVRTDYFRHFWVDLQHGCPLDTATTTTTTTTATNSEDDEEFDCPSNKADSHLDMDPDAEPACSVDLGGSGDLFSSNALHSLQSTGFESPEQKSTFHWNSHSDPIVQETNSDDDDPAKDDDSSATATGNTEGEPLDDECDETFWNDLCSGIGKGSGATHVNLSKNPEQNTGYNGTHIWRAIYEENCVVPIEEQNEDAMIGLGVGGFSSSAKADTCLEERVLYRLFSGLHTQTTIGIAHAYYPPSARKNRTSWEPNAHYFYRQLGRRPEYIRNLHFSYAVLLRALHKAAPFLYQVEIATGNVVQDEAARILFRRLLDTPSVLQSCSSVFDAFDESELFRPSPDLSDPAKDSRTDSRKRLRQNFKGVFHNVSSILDCVQCQQCKLHGKLAMMGYGAALKVLLAPPPSTTTTSSSSTAAATPRLDRNEIVALVNSVAKFSQAIRHVRELTQLYISESASAKAAAAAKSGSDVGRVGGSLGLSSTASSTAALALDSAELVDQAVGALALLGRQQLIPPEQEEQLVQMALARNLDVLIAAKHYGDQPERLARLVSPMTTVAPRLPDAIVVGSGLAGMAATLNILDRGGKVIMLEKEHLLGGNSNKASSGINAYRTGQDPEGLEIFRNDTTKSAGSAANPGLIDELVKRSSYAVEWLQSRVGADLSLVARLGGHSLPRTHRPANGMVGAEIIFGMQREAKKFLKTGQLELLTDTQVTKLLTEGDRVVGVECRGTGGNETEPREIKAAHVVLATGGFASDRSQGSYLDKNRPELMQFPATAGPFSTGDGITLATTLGAGTVDMDKVQIHPTGWVDPADPENQSKILAAELMRGVGGLLINSQGQRFCNEVGTRAYVSEQMLSHDPKFAKTKVWDHTQTEIPEFYLVLSSAAAEDASKHVDLYTHKGLLTKVQSIGGLARFMGLPKAHMVKTMKQYLEDADAGVDSFGKSVFNGLPRKELERETFYVGKVVPVLHYCMGGITIDTEGNVLNESGAVIQGLSAAGEVTGGVHGVNRLAGNSLLECTVFGTIVGQRVPIQSPIRASAPAATKSASATTELRTVSLSELEKHNTPEDCWVSIHGTVYDLTEFADEHPAGPLSIHELAGQDGTKAFSAVHSLGMMDDFEDERIGKLES